MSTRKTNNPTNCPRVIVKAFQGEPVEMVVVAAGPDRVSVARRPGGEAIPLPPSIVRVGSDSIRRELRKAFDTSNTTVLTRLWDKTKPFAR